MATAAELLRVYGEQAGLEADEAISLLVDFFATYGMTSSVAGVLCDHIDDEGMTEDFAALLRENGLTLDPGADAADDLDLGEEATD